MSLIDVAAERAYLGACIQAPTYAGEAGVMPHEMGHRTRAAILAAILAVSARGEALDTVSVRAELGSRGEADRCTDELLEVTSSISVPTPGLPKRVRALAKARAQREACLRAAGLLEAGRLEDGESELRQAIGEVPDEDPRTLTMREVITKGVESVFERASRSERGERVAITTGVRALDLALGDSPDGSSLGGWEPGDYVVIGGDTNAGKSSLALTMALAAARTGVRVGVVQVEDPEVRVGLRALSMATSIPQWQLRSARLSQSAWQRVASAAHNLADLPMFFQFRIAGSLPAICAAVRALVRLHGCEVVVIDYLQAIQVNAEPRLAVRDVISETRRVAAHAGERPAVVIALSQFRKRDDETTRPSRSDLYESAYIAQKAEHIVLIWKDGGGRLQCVLDKTKDGRTGATWSLARDPDTGQLVSEDDLDSGGDDAS